MMTETVSTFLLVWLALAGGCAWERYVKRIRLDALHRARARLSRARWLRRTRKGEG